jgi:hypothetical protein
MRRFDRATEFFESERHRAQTKLTTAADTEITPTVESATTKSGGELLERPFGSDSEKGNDRSTADEVHESRQEDGACEMIGFASLHSRRLGLPSYFAD